MDLLTHSLTYSAVARGVRKHFITDNHL